jgi:hypothetical protein
MSTPTLDSFVADFERHLGDVEKSTLQQWQFAYKRVIFAMGLKILEKFPRNALGPEPTEEDHGGGGEHAGGGGPKGGAEHGGGSPFYRPAGGPWGPIIHTAIAVSELAPPPPPPSPPPRR